METAHVLLTVVHLLAAIAWLGGMVFHLFVLDPVVRRGEVSFATAAMIAQVERRFRVLVGTSIALLAGSGIAKGYLLYGSPAEWAGSVSGRYLLAKVGLSAAMVAIFAVCPKTKSCSSIPGVCERGAPGEMAGKAGTIRERSRVVLPKVALTLGVAALVAAVALRG